MKKSCAFIAVAAMLFVSVRVSAGDHVVAQGDIARRLVQASAERERDVALLQDALSSAPAQRAATMAGVDLGWLRSSLGSLQDDELRDLAARAEALKSDPVSGYHLHETTEVLMVLLLITAIVVVILVASDRY